MSWVWTRTCLGSSFLLAHLLQLFEGLALGLLRFGFLLFYGLITFLLLFLTVLIIFLSLSFEIDLLSLGHPCLVHLGAVPH